MKKIISLMLSFLITSSLVIGCSNTKEDNSDKSETTQKSTEKVQIKYKKKPQNKLQFK